MPLDSFYIIESTLREGEQFVGASFSTDDKIEIAQCGPAGEKLVRYAAIMNMSNRANGRTGMGAVMGSKNFKAVVVRGKDRPQLADRRGVIELAKWGADNFEDSDVYGMGLYGTAEVMNPQNRRGGQVTYNWDSGFFEQAEALDGTTMAKTILKERDTCYACTVRCKRVVEVNEGPFTADPFYGGPEYETLSTFGTYCGIDDLGAVVVLEPGTVARSAKKVYNWQRRPLPDGALTTVAQIMRGYDLRVNIGG